ncbi:Ycf66 family protein [Oscillatoria nigro-viridis PCC 7112]|uniref:Ycf66 family protein n=1 Tax=Phormidium nigroviride PCC 7112 TaxID=179408 RepID=K9VPU4_9CYAN|nr:Ycf66 family protein [Oscillatoria nigro-viridis]AFZ09255.1 Ycf66 family protein [Oscillatoria nigro-viridis PCC 7112]
MLAYILALAVGLGSFSIYMAAFFFPEVHRKSDFTWSGVGLFYALILWACAGRITGALLLGQMAGVAMLGWFAWETLTLRRQVTPVAEQTPIPQSANLAAAGVPFAGLFAKKKEPAAKKPKFVRSPKPKTDVVPAPSVDKGEVKLEEQPAIPPIAESIAESAIAPDLKIPDSKTPAISEIPVFSVETPAAETSQPPAESAASSFTPLPLPLEISEIAVAPSVEPAEAQPEPQQQPEADDFDEETEWRTAVKQSQAAAAAAAAPTPPNPPQPAKKSGGFASLFGNIKNSLGGMLGRGAGKNKSDATPQTPKPSATPESIAPESQITATPAPGIDQVLESELAEAAAEVAAETSNIVVETSLGVPFPTDVEAMADLMATETASSEKIGETPIEDRSSAQTQTPLAAVGEPEAAAGVPEAEAPAVSLETQTPLAAVGEPEAAAGVPEAEAPPASIEMTVVEMVSVAPVEMEASGESELSAQVEAVSVTVISIESTGEELSSEADKTELSPPNHPAPNLVETAKPATESKSENLSGEDKPSS